MIILGIDPGYAILGYGIIDAEGRKIRPVDYGVIETKAGEPFPERLEKLYLGMRQLVGIYKPEHIVFEELFSQHDDSTSRGGWARSSDACRTAVRRAAL